MTPERWQQVAAVFERVLACARDERAAALEKACAGDADLRAEVESLLATYDDASGSMLDTPPLAGAAVREALGALEPLVGKQVGPYEVVGFVGRGGMGDVYRARDARLGREVAMKILPAAYAGDPDRLRRFEQEARAAGMLNHPNVLAVFDVGTHEGSPFIVSELLEGETLRERLDGTRLSPRDALDYAIQAARGLAAAHGKGIVHRDLKPENLFLTRDGRVKILDFGVAKLLPPGGEGDGRVASMQTRSGVVVGTAAYMSPEQAQGKRVDQRSDIFSFGVILYEMLAGEVTFLRPSPTATMNSIIEDEVPDLAEAGVAVPVALAHIVRRCTQKDPAQRFQTASDLMFALEELALPSTEAPARTVPERARAAPGRRTAGALAIVLVVAAAVAATWYAGRLVYVEGVRAGQAALEYHQLTFGRRGIVTARLAPDGRTAIFSAKWGAEMPSVYSSQAESPDPRAVGLPDGSGLRGLVLAVSSRGELAILPGGASPVTPATLARVSLGGGAPRDVLDDVTDADWSPDGGSLAVVRGTGTTARLEYPAGTPVYDGASIAIPRVSRDGDSVAFAASTADGSAICVVDRAGKKTDLSSGWTVVNGLAWSPHGDEVWFTASRTSHTDTLYAVSLTGALRVVGHFVANVSLKDVDRDGRALVTRLDEVVYAMCQPPGAARERDLSWLDFSVARGLSADGRLLLIDENEPGGGEHASVYVRNTDGSPAVRLADGARGLAISPDGRWVLALSASPIRLHLLPTGAGEQRELPNPGIDQYLWAGWFPDGNRVLLVATEPGHSARAYVQDLATGATRAISDEGVRFPAAVAPDGASAAVVGRDGLAIYPTDGGPRRLVAGFDDSDELIEWGQDSRLYVFRDLRPTGAIYRLDPRTVRSELWREIAPSPTNQWTLPVVMTPDAQAYAYTYGAVYTDLFVVDGLR